MFIFFVMHELARASALFPQGVARRGYELKERDVHQNAAATVLDMIAAQRGCRESLELLVKAHRQIVGEMGIGSYVLPLLSVHLRCH